MSDLPVPGAEDEFVDGLLLDDHMPRNQMWRNDALNRARPRTDKIVRVQFNVEIDAALARKVRDRAAAAGTTMCAVMEDILGREFG